MLKQRIITGVILGSSFITAIFYFPSSVMAFTLALMMLVAAWEWTRLIEIKLPVMRLVYCSVIAVFMWLAWGMLAAGNDVFELLLMSAVWWGLALLWIMLYPLGSKVQMTTQMVKSFAGILVLLPCWVGMVKLHQVGSAWLLYIMVMVWVADSGAYFAGRQWGKRKLAAKVSPGKSWEGVMGAMVACGLYSAFGVYWLEIKSDQILSFILVCLALVPISVVGDLFESMIKRHSGHKDSGKILPGHGGILDRIDSWTAAVPLFVLTGLWFGWFQ